MLMFVSGYVNRLLRSEAQTLGIRWTALLVLKDLELLGPSSQNTLAEIEQVRAPTMTVLLSEMERRGWISRVADRSDARSKIVAITPEGRKKLNSSGRVLQRRLEVDLRQMDARDVEALAKSLDPLATALMKQVRAYAAAEHPS